MSKNILIIAACKKLDHCAKEKGVIYGGAWQLGDIHHNSAMQKAFEMGKAI